MFLSSAFDVVNHWTEAMIVVVVAIDRPTTMDLVMQLPNKTVTSYEITTSSGGWTTWVSTTLCSGRARRSFAKCS